MVKRFLLLHFILFAVIVASGQLCQGSLGDAVVNINFGTGSNPGPPLAAATTGYQYVGTDCPNDGAYTVRNSTTNCFSSSWHNVTSDHTGNGNGYFMLVNASIDPADFYMDTVRNLCGGTAYEFAAWVMNVQVPNSCNGNPTRPNLQFSIKEVDGNGFSLLSTGSLVHDNSPTWKQYGFFFKTSPGATTVVLRIRNSSPGGCGSDLALDDITFRPCGPQVAVSISGGTGLVRDLCQGDNAQITINSNVSAGFTNPALQWQQSTDTGKTWTDIPGATQASLNQSVTAAVPAGKYLFRLTVAEAANIAVAKCRVSSQSITIDVHAKPVTNANSNSPLCEKSTLQLQAGGGSSYTWTGPNNFSAASADPSLTNINMAQAGKYVVTVVSAAGCSKKDSVNVVVHAVPVANAGRDTTVCAGTTVQLNGSGGGTYLWVPATGLSAANIAGPQASATDSIQYILTVTNAANCKHADTMQLNVLRKPMANAGPDKALVQGQTIQLSGTATGSGISWYWTPNQLMDDDLLLQPAVSPLEDITYTLHVVSGCGSATDEVFVKVYKKIMVPNAFSPNGDGVNDTWVIEALQTYPDAAVQVFDRFGQLVFESKGYAKPWNGGKRGYLVPAGTYYYLIDTKLPGTKPLTGWVLILH